MDEIKNKQVVIIIIIRETRKIQFISLVLIFGISFFTFNGLEKNYS